MATTMTIDRISGIYQVSVSPTFARATNEVVIPGALGQNFESAIRPASFDISAEIAESTVAATAEKAIQLAEICDNLDYRPVYIQFAANENVLDGWFTISELRLPRSRATFVVYPFQLTVARVGARDDLRLATFWDNAVAETYTGWTSLTAKKMIALPHGVDNVAYSIAALREASDGTVSIIEDPTNTDIMYASATNVSEWFVAECRAYDLAGTDPLLLTSDIGLYLTSD
jgi:hypothetical protein